MKKGVMASVFVIGLGAAWLLDVLQVMASISWVCTIGLTLVGVAVVVLGGLNKMTFVVGPFLVVAALTSLLRQLGHLRVDVEIPTLVIVFGVLLLGACVLPLPMPKILDEENAEEAGA